jgi:hypothetical protein
LVTIVKSILHVVHEISCDTQLTERICGRTAACRHYSRRPKLSPLDWEPKTPTRWVLDVNVASSILTPHMV